MRLDTLDTEAQARDLLCNALQLTAGKSHCERSNSMQNTVNPLTDIRNGKTNGKSLRIDVLSHVDLPTT